MKTLKLVIQAIISLRFPIIGILLILMGFSIYHTSTKLRIDNSLFIWFLEDDPSYRAYIEFQEEYGSDEIFIAMFPVGNALDKEEVNRLKELQNQIEALPFVNTTFSLAKAKYPIYNNGTLIFDDLYNSNRSEKGLKSLFSKLPNITSQLVSEDYKNLFFYIQLNPTSSIETARQSILSTISETIEKEYSQYYLTGPPVLNEAYSKGIYKESMVFGILTVLVITLVLLFLLPSKRYLFVSLMAVAIPVTLLFGIITALGYALNMISMLIPTILLVYSVSDVVHIINIDLGDFQQLDFEKPVLSLHFNSQRFIYCLVDVLGLLLGLRIKLGYIRLRILNC